MIDQLFRSFKTHKVLIIGDVIWDAYMEGKVDRISPEAPVPIVDISRKEGRLGGAANVAVNINNLGAEALLCSVMGDDNFGDQLKSRAKDIGLATEGLLQYPDRKTSSKTRILSNYSQMLRIDEEIQTPLSSVQEDVLFRLIEERLPTCQVLIFQDYDKGVLTSHLISKTIKIARQLHVPVLVDPKERNFFEYKDATLFKPNLKEFEKSMHYTWPKGDQHSLAQAISSLRQQMNLEEVLITLSAEGMFAQNETESHYEAAHRRQIIDVSGAGDTVISVLALAKASGLNTVDRLKLANLAGGLVCEVPGVAPIRAESLLKEATRLAIFDKT